jgi:hypothetical protein
MDMISAAKGSFYVVETHSHFHNQVTLELYLDSARLNFLAAIPKTMSSPLQGILCLADFPGCEGYLRICEESSNLSSHWSMMTSSSAYEVSFRHVSGDVLHILAGRQYVSTEGLEVLFFGCSPCLERLPLRDMLSFAGDKDRFFILPWGAGKWLAERGRVLDTVLSDHTAFPHLALGDTLFRPQIFKSRHLEKAHDYGIPVLPGSDPLDSRYYRLASGRCGFSFRSSDCPDSLLSLVRQQIFKQPESLSIFGKRLSCLQFIRDQLFLRLGL